MTVAELIEQLSEMPQDSRVMYESDVSSYELTKVNLYHWRDGTADVELS